MYSLDRCQQVRQREDKEVTKSMGVCSKIHMVAHDLIKDSQLPQLDELGKNMVMEELVDKVQDSINHKRLVVETTTTITTNMIEQHLLQPVKLHTMIQAFMETLLKDMSNLEDSIDMHNPALEELAYRRIRYLYDQLKVWIA
jgi:HD superfamily phosphohydrolase YqeK